MTQYTVHAGSMRKTTESADEALLLALAAGKEAYVTVPSERTCGPKIVWTPGMPASRCRL